MRTLTIATLSTGLVLGATAPVTWAKSGSKITVPLVNAGLDVDASGQEKFSTSASSSKLTVRVRKAPPGATLYLRVGDVVRGSVVASSSGSANFKFRTGTTSSSWAPLDFDPRGAALEVEDAGGTDYLNNAGGVTLPTGSKVDERATLAATVAQPAASGDARYKIKNGVVDFDVEVEDVVDGTYDVYVDGVLRGSITTSLGRGKIEFSNGGDDPEELPLTFDPYGKPIEVRQGATVVLTGTMLADVAGVSVCTAIETTELLTNSGADPDGKGEARFRVKEDCDRDFQVQIEDVPVGDYDLYVGGVLRGTITVAIVLGEEEGQIEFDTDVDEPGEVLLTYDPRGQAIEVRQGATVFFTATFPN